MFVGKNGSFFKSPKPRKICKNKLEASNLFLQGMWCDMVNVTKLLYEMIFIVNITTGRSLWLSFIFYGLRAICISMRYIVMVEDNQGGGAMDLGAEPVEWWRSYHDAQDGDRNARRTISYHIIHACDVNPFLHLILLRYDHGVSIIRWSLQLNIKIIMCSSLVCTVKKVRHFEAPRDDRVW